MVDKDKVSLPLYLSHSLCLCLAPEKKCYKFTTFSLCIWRRFKEPNSVESQQLLSVFVHFWLEKKVNIMLEVSCPGQCAKGKGSSKKHGFLCVFAPSFYFSYFYAFGLAKRKKKEDADRKKGDTNVAHLLLIFL